MKLGSFLAGAVIGAAAVALTTPKTGDELRGEIKNEGDRLYKEGLEKSEELYNEGSRLSSEYKEKGLDLYNDKLAQADELKNKYINKKSEPTLADELANDIPKF